jgi:hypothetical protein
MPTPEQDAAQRAARGAAGAPFQSFVDFTTGLIHGVFETLVDTATEQMRAYVDLVTAVSGTLKDYQDKTLGDADAASVKYLNEFVVPEFVSNPPATPLDATGWKATGSMEIVRTKVESLIKIYDGVTIDGATISSPRKVLTDGLSNEESTSTAAITITRKDLFDFTKALLLRGVSRSFDELKALLQMGLMRVVPKQGFVETALMFDVTATDTSEQSSTQTDVDTASHFQSFNVNASLFGSRTTNTRSFLGLRAIGSSIAGSISGGYGSGSSSSHYGVKVVNDKSTSVTNVETNITGRVHIDFITDYFPLLPLTPPPVQPALPAVGGG